MPRPLDLRIAFHIYLYLFLTLASSATTRAKHHDSIANLLHRRHSPTSVAARRAVLMPRGPGIASWTTAPKSKDNNVTIYPLNDETLRPTHAMSNPKWDYGLAPGPDKQRSLIARYPKGSYNFQHDPKGGFSFYAKGPMSLENAKEVTFGYSVFFPKGFEFNKGGKLPGLYGGNSEEVSTSCSGGRRDDACFSARLMWRSGGQGELYTYLPPDESANNKQCSYEAGASDCNAKYGASVGRGTFKFARGQWTIVTLTAKLNDVGKANGSLQVRAGTQMAIDIDGLVLRTSESGKFRGMQFQTFFGGSTAEWGSPKDQEVYFSDITVTINQTL